jgi:hypothetical protein
VFTSIYVHLAIRVAPELGSLAAIGLTLGAGVSHSMQCCVADYYRNAFLYLGGVGRGELDEAQQVETDYPRPLLAHATSGASWCSACT